jgi:Heterokaryon incompatibility protein (HET)
MRIFEMGSSPEYTALPYTWGHPVNEDDLGTEKEEIHHLFSYQKLPGKLDVFLNLHDALFESQRSHHTGYIWIDALSIDQSNIEEKTHQVNMMCEIYEHASRVLMWLGKDDESAPYVMNLLDRLAQCASKISLNPGQVIHDISKLHEVAKLPREVRDAMFERLGIFNLNDEETTVLSAFFERRWLGRIWIIQEVALAKQADVRWGRFTVPWETLCDSIDSWELHRICAGFRRTHSEMIKRMETARRPQASIMRSTSALATGPHPCGRRRILDRIVGDRLKDMSASAICATILQAARSYCSKDPRDKAFGLLGVIREATRERGQRDCPIQADYGRTQVEIYKEATLFIMEVGLDLIPLSMVPDRSRVQFQIYHRGRSISQCHWAGPSVCSIINGILCRSSMP